MVESSEHLAALDLVSGEEIWRVRAAPGAVNRGSELFHAEQGDALVRLDALSGEVRWKRRLRGARPPARLWPLSAGVLRDLPGEGLALVGDSGALEFRAKLPGGAPYYVLPLSGVIGAALSSGSLAGLDATEGRILWKRRLRARAVLARAARL